MFTAESIKLLAKTARRQIRPQGVTNRDILQCGVGPGDESGPHPALDRGVDERLLLPPGDDPDANIDPDDSNNVGNSYISITPPEMSASWWEAMLLGNEDDLVSAADVKLVCRHIRQRLAERATTTGNLWNERNEKLDFISTISELHEAVQSLGELAWWEFQRAYHEAAGLKPKHKQKPDCAPIPAVNPDGKADTPLPPLPPTPYAIERVRRNRPNRSEPNA